MKSRSVSCYKKRDLIWNQFFNKDRELLIATKDGIEMIFGKANDVVTFLEHGIVDIGFVGKDTLDDVDFEDYYELLDLNIGKCYFAVAAYPEYRNKKFERRKKLQVNILK